MSENTNLSVYNSLREVPREAMKPFDNGRFKGTDINSMWRIKMLTETFGMVGFGWYYEVTKQWIETDANTGLSKAFANINLYVKDPNTQEWSRPIFGTGGNNYKTVTKSGSVNLNDECVDGDCEVLTKNGWVKFKDYNGEDEVAQFDKNTSEISFVKPINFITKWSLDTYCKENIIMTGGHRNLVEKRNGKRDTILAEKLVNYNGKGFRDIRCGYYGERVELTPLQKVGIMLCCDGTLFQEQKDGTKVWQVVVSKDRKIERILQYLKEAGIDIVYRKVCKRHNENWHDYTTFRFKLNDGVNYKIYKEFLPLANYNNLLEEAIFWDGNYTEYVKSGVKSFFSTDYENIKYLQTLLALSGEETTVYKKDRTESDLYKAAYTLYKHKQHIRMRPIRKYGQGCQVYCIEVPSTYFLLRKDNFIHVTGNCFKMCVTDAIGNACKSLGMGADVYWANDQTKYTQEVQEPNFRESFDYITAIDNARTITDLTRIYNEHPEYHTSSDFMGRLSAKKSTIQ